MATFSAAEKIEKKRKLNENPSFSVVIVIGIGIVIVIAIEYPFAFQLSFFFLSFSSIFSISPIHILYTPDPSNPLTLLNPIPR